MIPTGTFAEWREGRESYHADAAIASNETNVDPRTATSGHDVSKSFIALCRLAAWNRDFAGTQPELIG
jgi:hypothetical protein